MIRRLLRMAVAGLGFFCVATLIAQAVIAGYLVLAKGFDRPRLARVLAVARGIELPAAAEQPRTQPLEGFGEQPSYEQVLASRAMKARNLELREQALRSGLARLQTEQMKLAEDSERFQKDRGDFEKKLTALQKRNTDAGWEENRQALMTVKPKLAKELLMQMLEKNESDDVVALIAPLPEARLAKIIAEFKTPDELKKIDELLRLIRQGKPLAPAIDDMQQKLGALPTAGPQGTP
jgi:hypothetical protein